MVVHRSWSWVFCINYVNDIPPGHRLYPSSIISLCLLCIFYCWFFQSSQCSQKHFFKLPMLLLKYSLHCIHTVNCFISMPVCAAWTHFIFFFTFWFIFFFPPTIQAIHTVIVKQAIVSNNFVLFVDFVAFSVYNLTDSKCLCSVCLYVYISCIWVSKYIILMYSLLPRPGLL